MGRTHPLVRARVLARQVDEERGEARPDLVISGPGHRALSRRPDLVAPNCAGQSRVLVASSG
jgi:hypothetical protein